MQQQSDLPTCKYGRMNALRYGNSTFMVMEQNVLKENRKVQIYNLVYLTLFSLQGLKETAFQLTGHASKEVSQVWPSLVSFYTTAVLSSPDV